VPYTNGMSRARILILLGVLIALAPFSGLPSSWLEFALPVLGLFVLAAGYSFRSKTETEQAPEPLSVPAA